MPLDNVVFWIFAPLSVVSAVLMLTRRNAVHAALFLIVNFFTIAVMYLILDAPFLFAVQIIVYAGAIMVLFLFVIMLLGVDRTERPGDRLVGQRAIAAVLGVGFTLEVFFALRASIGFATHASVTFDATANAGGNPQALATVLFTRYFFPFEITSLLLIVAAVAAMVLANRRARAVTQSEMDALHASEGPADSQAEVLAP